jgi:arylformamidase
MMDVPMILSVGERETDEFQRHQTELFAAWSAKGLAVTEVAAPDCHHYTIVGHFGDPTSDLHKAMIAMMRAD